MDIQELSKYYGITPVQRRSADTESDHVSAAMAAPTSPVTTGTSYVAKVAAAVEPQGQRSEAIEEVALSDEPVFYGERNYLKSLDANKFSIIWRLVLQKGESSPTNK